MSREVAETDRYQEKVLKSIPSEIVLAYIALNPLVEAAYVKGLDGEEKSVSNLAAWIVVVTLTALTPIYLRKFQGVINRRQLLMSTIGFLIWVYSIGGTFLDEFGRNWGPWESGQAVDLHYAWIASALMIIWALLTPLLLETPLDQPTEA